MRYQIAPWSGKEVCQIPGLNDTLCGCLHQVDESIS